MVFQIGERKIGQGYKPLVIAEIGINHAGNLQTAKSMVLSAARAGAEIVKHQTHIIDDEMSALAKQSIPGNSKESIYSIMEEAALNEADEFELKKFTEEQGMLFLSTPFSRAAVHRLKAMDVQAVKIGSGECNNYPLIEEIAALQKPVILSTGMNNLSSIKKATAIFDNAKLSYALLHTTNLYPTPNHLVRLGAMAELAAAYPGIPYGLSDHTISNHACFAAVALGASLVERHFTDSMQRPGPDIVCSMDEQALGQLLHGIDIIYAQRGGSKNPAKEERVTMEFAFATVVSIQEIKKGETLSKGNIWVKRPGTGKIPAEGFSKILGKQATRDIPLDTHLNYQDFR